MHGPLVLATRRSPLALAQAELAARHLQTAWPEAACSLLHVTTTGDRRTDWSLEKQGGKGLFTGELEEALASGNAHAAIHSSKDLPTRLRPGTTLAGFLPRADARDVLVLRDGVDTPARIATGSPRRRLQAARLFPHAAFSELRGNVGTRLERLAAGAADATFLAAAGLARLGIHAFPGLVFRTLEVADMVPAVGQGAIAVQCRADLAPLFAAVLDAPTARAVHTERTILGRLGGGCQTSFAAHVAAGTVHVFHETAGRFDVPLDDLDPEAAATRVLDALRSLGVDCPQP